MLKTLLCMDKMSALHQHLDASEMLQGFGFSSDLCNTLTNVSIDDVEELEDEWRWGCCLGETPIWVRVWCPTCGQTYMSWNSEDPTTSDSNFHNLITLLTFMPLWNTSNTTCICAIPYHPDKHSAPLTLKECPVFEGVIKAHHSVTTTFYAPSDLSRSGGLQCELIQSTLKIYGYPHCDTVFIVTDTSQPGIAWELGTFSFSSHLNISGRAFLVHWYIGLYTLMNVTWTDSIACRAHLLPVYGSSQVTEDSNITTHWTVTIHFLLHYIDHHTHELLVDITLHCI